MNEYIVSAEQDGMRLDVFLTEHMEGSRSYIQSLIKGGHVTVGAKVGKANLRLTPNAVVRVEVPEPESVEVKPEDIPLDVLYEDHDIIIVNKQRGMVVHPAVGNYSGTLVNALLYHCKDLSGINGEIRPGIVHRLDKDTSGVMMAAKNDAAHIGLAEQVKEHSAKRTYLALVQGNIVEEKGTIKAPIGRHPKDRMKMAVVFENSKDAVTHFNVVERFGHQTLVECNLETGRTHQIRVHTQYAGHPIALDDKYGDKDFDKQMSELGLNRLFLHAFSIRFEHPKNGETLRFNALLDHKMKAILQKLRESK